MIPLCQAPLYIYSFKYNIYSFLHDLMARTDPQINIRVPAELKKKLELLAIENSRSLNAEVVTRLEDSLSDKHLNLHEIPLEKLMSVVMQRFGENSISLTYEEVQGIKKAP